MGAADVVVIRQMGAHTSWDSFLPDRRVDRRGHPALTGFGHATFLEVTDGSHGPVKFQQGVAVEFHGNTLLVTRIFPIGRQSPNVNKSRQRSRRL
jgi:hypothetical protein